MTCRCGHDDKDHVVHRDEVAFSHQGMSECSCFRPCFKCDCLGFSKGET